jgi:uncharacterized protein (TIGR00369 family)
VQSWPNAERFPTVDQDTLDRWGRFLRPERVFFPTFVGFVLDELRAGYARLRLPDRPEVRQVAGMVHGGALAALIDTSAIPAIATAYPAQPDMVTVSLTVNYVGGVTGEDAVAEAWVERATSSLAFVRVEVSGATSANLAATASLVFKVRPR